MSVADSLFNVLIALQGFVRNLQSCEFRRVLVNVLYRLAELSPENSGLAFHCSRRFTECLLSEFGAHCHM